MILSPDKLRSYVQRFNALEAEDVVNAIPDAASADWMIENVPLFECPDAAIEEIYHFRWWTFRKHIKETPDGFVVTEFILPVRHAGVHNTVSCAFGHQLSEGRWIREQRYLDEYTLFWFRGNSGRPQPHFHKYSQWAADAILDRARVSGDIAFAIDLLQDLIADYEAWEAERRAANGLFWQYDVWDGMEESISGSRKQKNVRPTISSYMFANARAIRQIAQLARNPHPNPPPDYRERENALRRLVQEKLWDERAGFFKVMFEDGSLSDAREAIGFMPWRFCLPEAGFEAAWAQLIDPQGFWAPFGITTAERRHPKFRSHGVGHCEWDGAVWPFATSQTLDALANVLRHYSQEYVTRRHWFEALKTYAVSQHWGDRPYIGEYLDETTGAWLKGNNPRSRWYNHSTFCDLVIAGLVGLRPRLDEMIEVDPLLPAGEWDWFCLDQVSYHGKSLTIIWDRTGEKYGRGAGLSVLVDGELAAHAPQLQRVTA